jgi:glutamate-1-semialdehyde aminotransferase
MGEPQALARTPRAERRKRRGKTLLERLKRWRHSAARRDPAGDRQVYGIRWIDHDIPVRLSAGSVRGLRVTLENTGNFPWSGAPPGAVYLVVRLDGEWVDTHKLPRGWIPPGERTTVLFPFTAPSEPGSYRLGLDLIAWNEAHFQERGVPPLEVELVIESAVVRPSTKWFQVARRVNPWHYAPTNGICEGASGALYPVYAARAEGCRQWDLEGKSYLDYGMGYGSALLGHGHPRVRRALIETVEKTGPTVELPHALHVDVSRMLVEDFPCGEMAVLGKHGSDACTVAVRLARAFTGKRHVLYRGYHGWQDFWAEQPQYTGDAIPRRPEPLIHEFRYNDRDDFLRHYERLKGDLAAVMLEPSPHGGDRLGFELDDAGFLATVAQAARDAGALLIFDEIVTGYRYREGSVQRALGVVPDLACLGKAIAAGMPLSAVVGRADVMTRCMPRIFYPGPTFRGELYSLAAARAAIETYREEPVAEHVWEHGEKLRAGVEALCGQIGVAAACKGPPFRMQLTFDEPDGERLCLKRTLLVQETLKAGMLSSNGVLSPSYAHDGAALEEALAILGRALEVVAEAERHDDFERHIEIPPALFFSTEEHFE